MLQVWRAPQFQSRRKRAGFRRSACGQSASFPGRQNPAWVLSSSLSPPPSSLPLPPSPPPSPSLSSASSSLSLPLLPSPLPLPPFPSPSLPFPPFPLPSGSPLAFPHAPPASRSGRNSKTKRGYWGWLVGYTGLSSEMGLLSVQAAPPRQPTCLLPACFPGAFPSIEEIPENVVHDHEKNGLPRLSSFSNEEIQMRLKTYFKFFIVRDPFERLISAFKDKFVHNPRFEPWYRHEIAPGIIRKYRRNRTETRGIQFEDFVRYLGDPNHRWLDLQFGDHIIHWVTYVELCAPCEIRYSVIGHHETLEEDAPYILKEAGIDHLVSYPTIPPGITVYNKTKVEHYFLGISKRDIRRLYARFEGDFKLFGYQKPDFLLN
uniref:Carbohydrate sulfotransferase n=1 Tax=Sus scrofa TaxID=9823 RepID=A0A8D0PE62_PIG